ncbi:MAG: HAMP domain-containing sensor histidine kinase [Coriobacteriales bacterium]
MRPYSIRARVLYLAIVFALVLVGSVTVATYFFVADGMTRSAEDTSVRLAHHASRAVSRAITDAKLSAEAAGLEGEARESEAQRLVLRATRDLFSVTAGADEAAYALYIQDLSSGAMRLAWFSDKSAVVDSDAERARAVADRQPMHVEPAGPKLLTGMFSRADLGLYIVHIPLDLPDQTAGVLDVVYDPVREESILDSARRPMLIVAVFALLLAIMTMQIIMGWVLSLVENVKTAADSIDAGQLDVHLPEEGEHEISELAHSINQLIDRLRRRAEVQTRFVADASHELATPVAGIRGYVNILRDWGAEDPVMRDEAISAIDRESRRMARLCSDLLSMVRSEEVLEFKSVRYDINAVSREVLAGAATRYLDKDLEFVGPEEGPLWLYGDPDRVEEALAILVDNACKYTPAAGRVEVSTRRHRDRVIIEVLDTGVGIPEEDLPNIFERFYRSDASRSKETGGFGLGLPIAKQIIDTSGGMIWVRSKPGAGTTFTISLPRSKPHETKDST